MSCIHLSSCSNLKPLLQDNSLRLTTFNIRYASAKDNQNSWKFRKNLIVTTLRNINPDIFGLQEAEYQQLEYIKKSLPHYQYFGQSRDKGKSSGEFSAIFFNPARFQLLEQDTFWFSDTPTIPGSMSWGNFIPRICSWGRFEDLANKKTFYIYNMHWDHSSQTAREKSAQLLIKNIRTRTHNNDPIIVMGDFNAGPGNLAYDSLIMSPAISLIDSYSNFRQTAQGTFHGFSGKALSPRIDSILVSSNITIMDSSIIQFHQLGKYPSDHFPVTAVLKLH